MRTAHRTCPLCEAVCGLRLTLDDTGHVTSVKGDPDDPEWREATWEEAFQAVDQGLKNVIDTHGRQALAVYLGNPNAHSMAGALYGPPLIRALGTRNVFSASSADQMPKHVSCGLMFGDPLAIAVPDLDRTGYLLMLGANPLESNGSLCTAPDFPGRLKALRARGGKLVVVDPRRTRTAALADEHLFVRPGTDAYLLLGIVHTLFAEDLTAVGVEADGLEEVRRLAMDFAPETVAQACGVPAGEIVRLARELAAAPTAAVYARIGTCTAEFGTVAQWLVDVVNILTGNFDRPGGVMFAKTAVENGRRRRQPGAVGAERAPAGPGLPRPGLHGLRGPLPERDDPARERHPAAAARDADAALRPVAAVRRGAQLRPVLPAGPAAGAGTAVGGRDPGTADDDRLGAGGGRRSGPARRDDPRPDVPQGRRDARLTGGGLRGGRAARLA
ncbi:molybdopterin-dependent oxidoreductase [Streptosporangium roseum]|uniref:molybdopterin-dependent oxidoreductase n=1 Tax=Streptosporangium roseum TaxID=2001 RepID=UPI000B2E310D|nr:molybdopterin-dependent oxidoreductase [Streptosporangium roseum]